MSITLSRPPSSQFTVHTCVRPALFASATVVGTFAVSGYLKWKSTLLTQHQQSSPGWTFSKMLKVHTHSANAFFYPVVAANVAVFALWNWKTSPPSFLTTHFLYTHGVSSIFSPLGATFSHQELWHLACNMVSLFNFSKICVKDIGTYDTAAMYLSSGILSSLVSGFAGSLMGRNLGKGGSLGASGAVCALTTFAILNHHDAKLSCFFFRVDAMNYLKFNILYDVVGLMYGGPMPTIAGMKQVGHAAHLGGVACGYLFGSGGGLTMCKWFQRKFNVCVWRIENWCATFFAK